MIRDTALTKEIKLALQDLSLEEKRLFYPKYFKTGKGEYSEGDEFIGVSVPDQRRVAQYYSNLILLGEVSLLLQSKVHEHRLCALFILVRKFEKTKDQSQREEIVNFYLKHLPNVNNWDLVDSSCYKILGAYCYHEKRQDLLLDLAQQNNMWSHRIAVVSTLYFIKQGSLDLTLELVRTHLNHKHDLMQKANGWMLREIGKKDQEVLLQFLSQHYRNMPRTTLRYAIERFEEQIRQSFLKGTAK